MPIAMQSLAASPSAACTASDGAALRRKVDDAHARGSEAREAANAPKGRHALLAALTEAVDALAPASAGDSASAPTDESSRADRDSRHALHAFVHELFAALRPAESEGRTGRGFAWGRTSTEDFAQRLDALVQRLQGSAAPAPSDPSAVPAADVPAPAATATSAPPASDTSASTTPPDSSTLSTAAGADAPATAPSPIGADPLLAAFRHLLDVRQPADSGAVSGSGIDALVALLQRMAQSLGGHAASVASRPGTLLDVAA